MNSNNNMYFEIARIVHSDPQRIGIETQDGATFSYGDIDAQAARYANCLLDSGLKRGDRVAVQVEKSVQSLFLYLACLRAGLVYLPLNTAYRSSELDYFLRDAEPGLVVVQPKNEAVMNEVSQASIRAPVVSLGSDGGGHLAEQAASADTRFETVRSEGDDLAVIIYTSGTTGRSKGAMVTHRNLVSNVTALTDIWRFSGDDVLLHALPIFHVHGLFVANHCALTTGARMLWHDRFDTAAVTRDIERATVFMGVPTYYVRLLADGDLTRARCSRMRVFISGSAPLLAETHGEFEQRTGHRILERYGMSETGMITSNPLDGDRRRGTVGFALPGVSVRVVDEADQPLPVGKKGAIQVKGENVFSAYWRMPEKTRQEFAEDGWFRTLPLLRSGTRRGPGRQGRLHLRANPGGSRADAGPVGPWRAPRERRVPPRGHTLRGRLRGRVHVPPRGAGGSLPRGHALARVERGLVPGRAVPRFDRQRARSRRGHERRPDRGP